MDSGFVPFPGRFRAVHSDDALLSDGCGQGRCGEAIFTPVAGRGWTRQGAACRAIKVLGTRPGGSGGNVVYANRCRRPLGRACHCPAGTG